MSSIAQIIYTVVDDSGDEATTTINTPQGFSLAQWGEFAVSMATLLDAFLAGRVNSADLCLGVDISGLTSNSTLSTGDREEIGAFQFGTLQGFRVNVNIPGIDELVVADGTDDLDQTNADVSAFISAMETGIVTTGGTLTFCDVAEDDITSTIYARERFRSSGSRE